MYSAAAKAARMRGRPDAHQHELATKLSQAIAALPAAPTRIAPETLLDILSAIDLTLVITSRIKRLEVRAVVTPELVEDGDDQLSEIIARKLSHPIADKLVEHGKYIVEKQIEPESYWTPPGTLGVLAALDVIVPVAKLAGEASDPEVTAPALPKAATGVSRKP